MGLKIVSSTKKHRKNSIQYSLHISIFGLNTITFDEHTEVEGDAVYVEE